MVYFNGNKYNFCDGFYWASSIDFFSRAVPFLMLCDDSVF